MCVSLSVEGMREKEGTREGLLHHHSANKRISWKEMNTSGHLYPMAKSITAWCTAGLREAPRLRSTVCGITPGTASQAHTCMGDELYLKGQFPIGSY